VVEFMSKAEVAARLCVSTRTVSRLVKSDPEFPQPIKRSPALGAEPSQQARVRFRAADVERYRRATLPDAARVWEDFDALGLKW